MLRATLRGLRRQPLQWALATLGVAAGVALVLALALASASAREGFARAAKTLAGPQNHRLVAANGRIPEALYLSLRREHGWRGITPLLRGYLTPSDAPLQRVEVLGIDVFAGTGALPAFGDRTLQAGTLERLVAEPGTALASAASRLPAAGQTLRLQTPAGERVVEVIGRLPTPLGPAYPLLVVDLATAQELLGLPGVLSAIEIDAGVQRTAGWQQRLQQRLPAGVRLIEHGNDDAALAELGRAYELSLAALSGLAPAIAVLLIHNALNLSLLRRRRELAAWRAVGTDPRRLRGLLWGEVAAVTLLGTAAGLVAGIVLSRTLLTVSARTLGDLYQPLGPLAIELAPGPLLLSTLVGLGAGALGAVLPIRRLRHEPLAELLRGAPPTRSASHRAGRAGIAAAILTTAVLLFVATDGIEPAYAALFLGALALMLLAPQLVSAPVALWTRYRQPNPFSAMVLRGQRRDAERNGVAVAALILALGSAGGLSIMIDSFRTAVGEWLQQRLAADLYLRALPAPDLGGDTPLPAGIEQRLARMDGVDGWSSYRWSPITLGRLQPTLNGVALHPRAEAGYRLMHRLPDPWPTLRAGRGVLVSEPLARRLRLRPGAELALPHSLGALRLPVLAVFRDYGNEQGRILIDAALYQRHWGATPPQGLAVYASPGSDPTALRAALDHPAYSTHPGTALLEGGMRVFDQTFVLTRMMAVSAAGVAFLALLGTLLGVLRERRRELAILRCIGLDARRIARLLTAEVGLLALLAGVCAIPAAALLGALLTLEIHPRGFGWSIPFQYRLPDLLQPPVLALLAAALALPYPLWEALRNPPATSLRQE